MNAHPTVVGIQDAGCAVLAVLASNDHVKAPIMESRGPLVIANALKAHPDSAQVVHCAAAAISNLVAGNST